MQKLRLPLCRLTGSSTIALKKCQSHSSRISCPVMALVVSMKFIKDKFSIVSRRIKNPPAIQLLVFKVAELSGNS